MEGNYPQAMDMYLELLAQMKNVEFPSKHGFTQTSIRHFIDVAELTNDWVKLIAGY